jgi:hypothetical protein
VPLPDPVFKPLTVRFVGGGVGGGGGVVANFASTKIRLSITKLQMLDVGAHIAPAGDPDTSVQPVKLAPESGTAVIRTCEFMKKPSVTVCPVSHVMKAPLSIRNVALPGPVARTVRIAGELNRPNTDELAFKLIVQGVAVLLQTVADPVPALQT